MGESRETRLRARDADKNGAPRALETVAFTSNQWSQESLFAARTSTLSGHASVASAVCYWICK